MNTSDYLLQYAADDDFVFIAPKARHTYKDLKQAVHTLAQALSSIGVKKGERVGILGSNSLFWAASYLSTMKAGAIAVPFATKLPPHELAGQIEQTECRVICVEKKLSAKYSPFLQKGLDIIGEEILEQAFETSSPISLPDVDENEDAAWMLTSGTTAKPRITRVTHANIQANTDSIIQYLELTRLERMLSILPFYYCYGTSLLHTHLRVGGSLALADSVGFPEKVLDLMEETACTGFAGVPTTFQMYLRNSTFPQRGLPALRKIQQAGGKLMPALIEELVQSHPHAKVFVMYGQTEATARLSHLPPDLLTTKLGSIGRGIPGVELKVVNEAGATVKPGEVGEIVAWGGNISPGYVNEPEASAEKFVNGSLRTGDMATVDDDGYIYIVDRKSDFIKSYGNRVSSQEVEACVLEIKDVVSAAAIGVPDPIRGEAIRVFVARKAKSTLTEEEIIQHCMRRLARYMAPKEIVFIQSLPTNQHGKVVKSELRKES
jgi:acyl-CoA synthetase (AMP-forming)/AMP-acid ligase II